MKILMHERTARELAHLIDQPAHAIGVSGETGAGKGFIATYLAGKLLNLTSISTHPYVHHIDVAEIKAGIDAVREAQSFLSLKVPGSQSIKRILIFEHIDFLKHEAQNALLKTLEEPPIDTVIICTFSLPEKVLPTIHSRLRTVTILAVPQRDLVGSEPSSDRSKAYHLSGGLAGLYCTILDQSDDHPLLLALDEAKRILGMSRFSRLAQVDRIAKHKTVSTEHLLDALYRLLRASYEQMLGKKTGADLQAAARRLACVEQAISDESANVQTKLVLSRLFQEL